MAFTGQCACRAVTARISADAPIAVRQCWCRQCQQASAGAATTNAMFPTESVALDGTLATHAYVANSGNTLTHFFCPACGTAVMAQSSARPHIRTMRLGFLDEGHGLRPQMAIWTSEAPAWAVIDPALARFDRQPPPPPAPPA